MEFEKLFNLIHSLSPQQRKHFTYYTSGKRNTRSYKLYQRIIKSVEFTKETQAKIRRSVFKEPSQFNADRERLATWIIKSILMYEKGGASTNTFIKKAFLVRAEGLARKVLASEVRRIQNTENTKEIADLCDLVYKLQNQYSIDISLNEDIEGCDSIFAIQNQERLLNKLMIQIRAVRNSGTNNRKESALIIRNALPSIYLSPQSKCYGIKILMNLAYLEEDYERAQKISEDYIPLLWSQKSTLGSAMLARELRFVSALNIRLFDRDAAISSALRLSRLVPESPLEELVISVSKITIYSTIAACFGEIELAKAIADDIAANEKEFEYRKRCQIYFNMGVAFFFNEDYQNAITYFQKARNISRKPIGVFLWEPELYLAICYFELGDISFADSLLNSSRTAATEIKWSYPSFCIDLIGKYFRHSPSERISKFAIEKMLVELDSLVVNPEERRVSSWFKAQIWLRSKHSQVSQRQILLEPVPPKQMNERLSAFS